MGTAERRERQRAELRDQILAAAARIIAKDGFDALTMRKIADAIEYAPATIYLYFASRDEIALELVRDGFAKLVQRLAPTAAIADPLERIRALADAYLGFAMREPETYRLIFMEDERFASPIMLQLKGDADNPGENAFGLLRDTVAELVERGIYRPLPVETIAALLWSSLHGIAALKLSCRDYPFEGSVTEPGALMVDIINRGLQP